MSDKKRVTRPEEQEICKRDMALKMLTGEFRSVAVQPLGSKTDTNRPCDGCPLAAQCWPSDDVHEAETDLY